MHDCCKLLVILLAFCMVPIHILKLNQLNHWSDFLFFRFYKSDEHIFKCQLVKNHINNQYHCEAGYKIAMTNHDVIGSLTIFCIY